MNFHEFSPTRAFSYPLSLKAPVSKGDIKKGRIPQNHAPSCLAYDALPMNRSSEFFDQFFLINQ